VLAAAQRRLSGPDAFAVLGHVWELKEILVDVLVVEHALFEIALANSNVPIPTIYRLRS
jgi:hypothetical protein